MSTTIGFVLLTHTKPDQIRRLTHRLTGMFDGPPIICHHDFSQCRLDPESFPENVAFVRPHLKTQWATFSLVEATVRAIGQMYENPESPDWFVLLSGTDYPIKPAARILDELAASPHDAHIDCRPVATDSSDVWIRRAFDRYCMRRVHYPSLSRRLRLTRQRLFLRHRLLWRPFSPFSATFHCYAGRQWFCANRRAAKAILEFHATRPRLAARYQRANCPDESYFQCILGNASHLSLGPPISHYTDWTADGDHPKTLGVEDLPKLLASDALFARKFDVDHDADVLNELDGLLDPHSLSSSRA